MDGGHETVQNAELVVQHLDGGSKTVGGAGGRGNDVVPGRIVNILVHAHDDGGVGIVAGSGNDDFLRAAGKVHRQKFALSQRARGIHHNIHAVVGPLPFALVATGDGNFTAVESETVFRDLHLAGEAAVHGIILEQVAHFLVGGAMAVDDHHLALREEMHDTKQISADTPKPVDAYSDHDRTLCLTAIRRTSASPDGQECIARPMEGTIQKPRVGRTAESWQLRDKGPGNRTGLKYKTGPGRKGKSRVGSIRHPAGLEPALPHILLPQKDMQAHSVL